MSIIWMAPVVFAFRVRRVRGVRRSSRMEMKLNIELAEGIFFDKQIKRKY